MARPFRKPRQQYYLPNPHPTVGPRRPFDGTVGGHDVLQYIAGPMKKPLTTALEALERGELGTALHWFGECAKIDPMNKAVLYFGSEAMQKAYFQLKLASPAPPEAMLKRWREAAVNISQGLCEAYPDPVVVHNYGRFLQDDGYDELAIPIYEQCVKQKRDQVETWGNLGTAYFRMGRRKDAETAWSKCVAFPAENASGHMAQGYIWVRRGEWQRGFQALNRRWDDRTFLDSYGRKDLNKLGKPWNGGPLKPTDALLLHGEQGLGDHIMFARYLPILRARGFRVAGFETRQPLKGWFDACWLGCPVVIRDHDPLPPFTHHVPVMSLHGILGLDAPPPPLAPPLPVPPPRKGPFRVGLVWKGARGNVMDLQRSLPEDALSLLAQVRGVEWVPLQYDPDGADALTAAMWMGDTVVAPPAFDDVLGMADVMLTCDHVLTVDTLAAHVAGSLGVPSTVLHRYHREWRWGIDVETTPWYATQRMLTCPFPEAWQEVMATAAARIQALVPQHENVKRATISVPLADTHLVTVAGRYGTFVVNRNDQFVGRSLIEYGEFSKGEGDLFQALVQPTWTVIEVGANIGAHTKQLVQLAQHVTAFEPNPENFALLAQNAVGATLHQAAVGNDEGTTTVTVLNPKLPNNFGGIHVGEGGAEVPQVTLEGLVCDFLKMDCEGMELEVLEGCPFLVGTNPVIYAEADSASKATPLLAFLHERGYRTFWHAPKLYAWDNFTSNPVNHFGDTVSVNVLALPATRTVDLDYTKHGLLPTATTRIQLQP